MNCFIGIDIGTTNIKAVVINNKGNVLNEFEQAHSIQSPKPGYSEQDPEIIVSSIFSVIKKSVEHLPTVAVLKSISFSSAMHSIMAVDKNGQPLTTLITWADTRAHSIATKLKDTTLGKSIYKKTGTPIHAMSPLCKIAWLQKEEPAIFNKASMFISAKEYLFFRLFNQYIIDYSIASATGLFNNETLDWEPEALLFAGIHYAQLSKPVPITTAYSGISKTYMGQLSLPADVLFIAGGSDGCMANLGSFAVNNNEAAITIGTSGAVRRMSTQKMSDNHQRSFQYLVDEHTFVNGGAINNGGIALQWFLKNFYGDVITHNNIDELLKEVEKIPAGAEGLIFLPYVFGERTPVWDAAATGAFVGIRSSHTRIHFLRAVLEGICFSLLQVLKVVEENNPVIDTIFASGGFIKSNVWVQMLSDILNKKILINSTVDASALGAAFVALKQMGVIQQWQDVKHFFTGGAEFIPGQSVQQAYQHNYSIFITLYQKLKD